VPAKEVRSVIAHCRAKFERVTKPKAVARNS
jgi:hypothetical protein